MSNVDDEGKLSSLVLTKSEDEVSLEVVEYAVGGGSSSGANIHAGDFIGNEESFVEGEFKVGDVIVDPAGFVGTIEEISFSEDLLLKVVIRGLESTNMPTTHTFEYGDWYDTELAFPSGGTKLYLHDIEIATGDSKNWYLRGISTNSSDHAGLFSTNIAETVSILYVENLSDDYRVCVAQLYFSELNAGEELVLVGINASSGEPINISASASVTSHTVTEL